MRVFRVIRITEKVDLFLEPFVTGFGSQAVIIVQSLQRQKIPVRIRVGMIVGNLRYNGFVVNCFASHTTPSAMSISVPSGSSRMNHMPKSIVMPYPPIIGVPLP